MNRPADIKITDDMPTELAQQCREVNRYLAYVDGKLKGIEREMGRLMRVRGNVGFHAGQNGITLNKWDSPR